MRLDYDYEPDLDVDELDELDGVDMKRKAASVMNDVSETREAVDACRCMRTSAWKDNSKSYVDFFPKAAAANTKDLFGFAYTEEYVLKCAGNLDIKIANLSCTTFNITHRPVSIHEDKSMILLPGSSTDGDASPEYIYLIDSPLHRLVDGELVLKMQ